MFLFLFFMFLFFLFSIYFIDLHSLYRPDYIAAAAGSEVAAACNPLSQMQLQP